MTARFLSVAKGNISRLRDAQAFHAAVKRPPYFMFARSADISPPGQLARLARSFFRLGSMTSRQGALQLRAPTKNIRRQNAVGYFLCRLVRIRAARDPIVF